MTHDELIEKVAREICLVTGRMGDPLPIELQRVNRDWGSYIPAAQATISTILAALLEPTASMKADGADTRLSAGSQACKVIWQTMLAASALGEQSNG